MPRRRTRQQVRRAFITLVGTVGLVMVVASIGDLTGAWHFVSTPTESFTLVADTTTVPVTTTAPTTSSTTPPTTEPAPPTVLVDPASFGTPWGTAVQGVLTFRGNPTRSFYGTGPVPRTEPSRLWKYPEPRMCGESSEYDVIKTWCGTGWTGQPAVFEREGRTWLVFGAYDYKIHFVDASTGVDIIPPFETGDLAKGNVTIDPDGFPIAYVGSRDNKLYAIAFDGSTPRELWSEDANTDDRVHNNDWDAAPIVVQGHLIEGSENSWFYGWTLDRAYDGDGKVTLDVTRAFREKAWDDELVADLAGDDAHRLSVESSVAISGDTAYFQTSGGLVQGWDLSSLRTGEGKVRRTFRFWTGDDGDSTIVVDDEGFLYVGVEVDRNTPRARDVGQLLKLDPRKPDDPVVWAVDVNRGVASGPWATPVVLDDVVIWTTKPGRVIAVDRSSGEQLWTVRVGTLTLSSPIVIDGVLLQGDGDGDLHAWDLSNPRVEPTPLWTVNFPSNVESTPVVWNGRIYVGSRDGHMYCLGVE
ncbi:MAG: PQQ-binding-like beta-propeller repeat protein [Ilumatobacteraceae bacterium]